MSGLSAVLAYLIASCVGRMLIRKLLLKHRKVPPTSNRFQ